MMTSQFIFYNDVKTYDNHFQNQVPVCRIRFRCCCMSADRSWRTSWEFSILCPSTWRSSWRSGSTNSHVQSGPGMTENRPNFVGIKIIDHFTCIYRAFHRFGQIKFVYGGPVLGSSQFLLLLQLPPKMMLASKMVKIDSKIIISLH